MENNDYWNKVNVICSIFIAIVAVLALVASVIASINSYNLSKQVMSMTSPKYAYIDSRMTDYIGDIHYVSLTNINDSINGPGLIPINFNILNMGQSNTGRIQLSERPYLNSDQTFMLNAINIENIAGGNSSAFILNFSVSNDSAILGLHQINLSIYCENCLEQRFLITKTVYICAYNDSKYEGFKNWSEVVADSNCKQFN